MNPAIRTLFPPWTNPRGLILPNCESLPGVNVVDFQQSDAGGAAFAGRECRVGTGEN